MATSTVDAAPLPGSGSLGIRAADELTAHARIMKGFPFAALVRFGHVSGFSAEQIAAAIHVSSRTLARRKIAGRLRWDESDRLFRLAKVFDLATALFEGDRARAVEWLGSPQKALGGVSPLSIVQTESGGREVSNLIGRLEHGVFT